MNHILFILSRRVEALDIHTYFVLHLLQFFFSFSNPLVESEGVYAAPTIVMYSKIGCGFLCVSFSFYLVFIVPFHVSF